MDGVVRFSTCRGRTILDISGLVQDALTALIK